MSTYLKLYPTLLPPLHIRELYLWLKLGEILTNGCVTAFCQSCWNLTAISKNCQFWTYLVIACNPSIEKLHKWQGMPVATFTSCVLYFNAVAQMRPIWALCGVFALNIVSALVNYAGIDFSSKFDLCSTQCLKWSKKETLPQSEVECTSPDFPDFFGFWSENCEFWCILGGYLCDLEPQESKQVTWYKLAKSKGAGSPTWVTRPHFKPWFDLTSEILCFSP